MIKFATIVLNAYCNQSCVWCYNMSKLDDSHQTSEKTFDNILIKLVENDCDNLILIGGEPTLHPLLPHFIIKAIEAGIDKVFIVSNGYYIHKDFFDVLKKHQSNVVVNVSIHGSNKEIHDKLTQTPGSFDALISNINAYHKHGFVVNAQTTVCRSNQNDISRILSILEENDIKNVLFNYCMRPVGAKVDCDEFISVSMFCDSIYKAVNNYFGKVHIEVGPHLPKCLTTSKFQELINKKQISIDYGCGFNMNYITIDPRGNVLLCQHLPDLTMGNINTICDLSLFIQEIKAKVNSNRKYPMSGCKDCNCISDCFGGGCPVFWLTNKIE